MAASKMEQPVEEAGVDLLKEMGMSITSVEEMERGRMAELKMQQPVAEAGVDRADSPANMLQEYALRFQNATAKELMDEWAMLERTHARLKARLRQQEGIKFIPSIHTYIYVLCEWEDRHYHSIRSGGWTNG